MRLVVYAMGLAGHIAPGVPIVLAARAAGHDVLAVTEPSGAEVFERFGISCVTVPHEYEDPDSTVRTDPNRGPVDGLRQSVSWVLRAAGAVDQVTSLTREFGADVMLRELAAFGGSIVGDLCDIPVASYEWTPPPTAMLAAGIGNEMAALRGQFGLAPDAELALFDRWLRLVLAPAWWGRGVEHLPDTAHFVRPVPPPSAPGPDWLGAERWPQRLCDAGDGVQSHRRRARGGVGRARLDRGPARDRDGRPRRRSG